MDKTSGHTSWHLSCIAAAALAAAALCGCQGQPTGEAAPSKDVSAPPAAVAPARGAAVLGAGRGVDRAAPTLRLSPDLFADLQGRVGPQTAARLASARDAGSAFAQRLGIEGPEAQSITDVFTQLAYDVAVAEHDSAAGSDERTAAVQQAAQGAIDGLRWLVPSSALPDAEREILRFTDDVPVKLTHPTPAQWARMQAARQRSPQTAPLP